LIKITKSNFYCRSVLSIHGVYLDRQSDNNHWKFRHINGGVRVQTPITTTNLTISVFLSIHGVYLDRQSDNNHWKFRHINGWVRV